MTKIQIKKMLLEVISHLDYDMSKDFVKETSEDWESAKEELDNLVKVVQRHLKKADAKTSSS